MRASTGTASVAKARLLDEVGGKTGQ